MIDLFTESDVVKVSRAAGNVFDLLKRHRNEIVPYEALINVMYSGAVNGDLHGAINELRNALGKDAIETIYSEGYRLKLE